jgi:hypothetical protein
MQKATGYKAEIVRQYGRAGRFVQRGLDVYRNMVSFYKPTPNQCIYRLLDHLARVEALGEKALTERQRENAKRALFTLIERAQEYDSGFDRPDTTEEIPVGDAEQVARTAGYSEARYANSPCSIYDDGHNKVKQHRTGLEVHDERVSFADPVIALSNYQIRASQYIPTWLSPKHEERFRLNQQMEIMDHLRAVENDYRRRSGCTGIQSGPATKEGFA